jgi:hypothetical protein
MHSSRKRDEILVNQLARSSTGLRLVNRIAFLLDVLDPVPERDPGRTRARVTSNRIS